MDHAKWSAYLRCQTELKSRNRVDHRSWGNEAALTALLVDGSGGVEDAHRAARSGGRKERHHVELRRQQYETADDEGRCPANELDAREEWREIVAVASANDVNLLCAVAAGYSFDELAEALGTRAGSLRVRVHRLRASIVARAA